MTGGESHIYAALEAPQTSHQYADPIMNPNYKKECPNNGAQQEQQQQQVPNGQYHYEAPRMRVDSNSTEGHLDNTSEHKYAVLEGQLTMQQLQGAVFHDESTPTGDDYRLHSFDKQSDPANHVYAVLEKLQ